MNVEPKCNRSPGNEHKAYFSEEKLFFFEKIYYYIIYG